ncbi:hypothetical protein OG625_07305 [Streptomyces sp. NBC_01351]|uniref:hypothetical protein n=1 Tax=Streptomyces sp. NBC_01351 TaxID=2903833 RepID=UPI002E3190C8|nr:hypothetical protein [Streptomyces sp. NBC_01351]
METATSLVIVQLAEYLRGLTQRLDSETGWYGEFLRRDPEGVRACLDGRAMVPWDVLESLLGDLAGARGAEFAERETVYAARLRAAAVTAWDRLPGGEAELRTLLAVSTAQRADSEAALRHLAARLSSTADPSEADALSLELSWTRDDATRAASRQADLTARLTTMSPPAEALPGHGAPAWRERPVTVGGPHGHAPAAPGSRPAGAPRSGPEGLLGAGVPAWAAWPGPSPAAESAGLAGSPGAEVPGEGWTAGGAQATPGDPLPGVPRQRVPEGEWPVGPAEGEQHEGWAEGERPVGEQREGERPVGRAEGRWLRGGRRSGGARYAGSEAPEALAATLPDLGRPDAGAESGPGLPAPRGARFGRSPEPTPRGARFGRPRPEPAPGPARPTRDTDTHPPARHPGLPAGDPAGLGGSLPAPFPGAPAGMSAGLRGWTADPFPGGPAGAQAGPGGAALGQNPGAPAGAWAGPDGQGVDRFPGDPAGLGGSMAGAFPGESAGVSVGDVRGVVGQLLGLRADGRSGEAHALLCEVAGWPAGWLPGVAGELGRAGLAADWATLLWEAASLPPERLAALAAALDEAGREADCDRLLRQGMARPAAEIAEAALALGEAGRDRETGVLLAAFVDVRTAEEAADLARRAPQWFAPRLLRAARALPGTRHRDLVHALRLAGIATA